MAIGTAFRIFFATLFDRKVAEEVRGILARRKGVSQDISALPEDKAVTAAPKPPVTTIKKPSAKATKNEAILLLETLQREARFVDFIKEDLTGYSDAQIGAAVRDVHRDCAAVLERIFAIRPLVEVPEGSDYVLPENFDSGRFRLVGQVVGQPPFRGKLTHHGWEATECRMPVWTGSESALRVIAPAEVEVTP